MTDMEPWIAELVYGPDDMYERYTKAFQLKHELGNDDVEAQMNQIREEMDELEEAVDHWTDEDMPPAPPYLEEEIVDILHSVRVFAQIVDADVPTKFEEKARYNLEKSGERNEEGKIIDDVDDEN